MAILSTIIYTTAIGILLALIFAILYERYKRKRQQKIKIDSITSLKLEQEIEEGKYHPYKLIGFDRRKLTKWIIITFIGLTILYLLSRFKLALITNIANFFLGILTIILAVVMAMLLIKIAWPKLKEEAKTEKSAKRRKEIFVMLYSMFGPLIAYILIMFYVWPRLDSFSYQQISQKAFFWPMHVTFVFIFAILLWRMKRAIWLTNVLVIGVLIMMVASIIRPDLAYETKITTSRIQAKGTIMEVVSLNEEVKLNQKIEEAHKLRKEISNDPNNLTALDPNQERNLNKLVTDIGPIGKILPPKHPKRQEIVKVIDVPANTIVNTDLKIKKGDRVEYEKFPHGRGYFLIKDEPRDIKTTANTRTTRTIEDFELIVEGGDEDIKLKIKVITGYYL